MKRILGAIIVIALLFSMSYGVANKVEAGAKSYQNCTELNKDYKGGVAETASTKNKGGKTKYKPHVSKELYEANKSKDRDKDGIACER